MNAQPRPMPAASASTDDTPLLRTLLLTDLCDSTEITEKRGDTAAAQIFRDLDRVVLELQQRWRGRLIDRSDGLLLLFERPIDGLGFALDYMKALKGVGVRHGVELRARAGLHVGEVLTWRNSVEAVQLGAKPLEVEGLTKPMAARLMTLARPGQILVSAIAEPLAHRAARELGERGEHLLWKSHGHWCFKGVPGKQEVHEVGEAGLAPLRMPKNGPKAWRDLPLWRRPASLVAEAVLLAGLGIGGWYAMKPEPAIAFAERDWVVMGDLRNLTGDPRLDESLEQAFRISLEQSRYVNVLSDLKARETLQRMQKPEGTAIDRAIASEIAVRDGVRAVILPMVSEVGGRLRVSAEVVDPRTQSTVYVESADGRGVGSALDSVDTVTGALRGKLGEALASIERDSKPLPQVTTSNIDALKSYALGQQAFDEGDYPKAKRLFDTAISLDASFAMAWLGGLRALNAQGLSVEAESYLRKGAALSARLAARDKLYMDAWLARFDHPAGELEAWKKLSEVYPDDFPALMNMGYVLAERSLFGQSLTYAQRAQKAQNPTRAKVLQLVGFNQLGLDRPKDAVIAYASARALGLPSADIGLARSHAALRDFQQAKLDYRAANVQLDDGVTYEDVSIALDMGDTQAALDRARLISKAPSLTRTVRQGALFVHSVAAVAAGEKREARQVLERMLALSFPKETGVPATELSTNCYTALQAGLFFGLTGDLDAANTVKAHAAPACSKLTDSFVPELSRALEYLTQARGASLPVPSNAPYSVALAARQPARGRTTGAGQSDAYGRGRLYGEQGCGWCQQPAYVYLAKRAAN
ncbi:putative peptide modification system cyclase [Solilutibacter oculi]|nr:putative peptide modification system cyclase [Lysobacter oculi]